MTGVEKNTSEEEEEYKNKIFKNPVLKNSPMKIKTLPKSDTELCFILSGINHIYANTLRRIMLVEVPTLAIEEVTFIKNDSALYDEIIAHRLGLLPLVSDLKTYEPKETCSCKGKGCVKCTLTFSLKAKGPCTVYASDLESTDKKVKPAFPETPITKLLQGQKLELEATAICGIGRDHIKFSPGLTYYRAYPIIELKGCKNKEIANICPKKVFEFKDKLTIKNLEGCDLCMACVEACKDNSIKVTPSETDFIFFIESFGQLKPKTIFETAVKTLDTKLDEFEKKLKSPKKEEKPKKKAKTTKKKKK